MSNIDIYEKVYKSLCHNYIECGLVHEELNKYDNFKDYMSEEIFKEVIRKKQARKNKRYRTKEKFKELYFLKFSFNNEGNVIFGTITLKNDILELKENTYIRKIHAWLKEHFLYTILNKDFGKKTEREHYHFVAYTKEPLKQLFKENGEPKRSKSGYYMYELESKDFKLGFEPTLNIIDLKKDNMKKTVNYLLKLNNHSNKITARNRVRIIKSPLMRLIELRHE